jgi:hypothetical protein
MNRASCLVPHPELFDVIERHRCRQREFVERSWSTIERAVSESGAIVDDHGLPLEASDSDAVVELATLARRAETALEWIRQLEHMRFEQDTSGRSLFSRLRRTPARRPGTRGPDPESRRRAIGRIAARAEQVVGQARRVAEAEERVARLETSAAIAALGLPEGWLAVGNARFDGHVVPVGWAPRAPGVIMIGASRSSSVRRDTETILANISAWEQRTGAGRVVKLDQSSTAGDVAELVASMRSATAASGQLIVIDATRTDVDLRPLFGLDLDRISLPKPTALIGQERTSVVVGSALIEAGS